MLFPIKLVFTRQKTEVLSRRLVIIALSAGLFALPAHAESGAYVPYSGIVHGTEGADPIELSVANETGVPLNCHAALAHWYSVELGHIAPGAELTLTLWHDAKTGVLNLMNATSDRMPVEALWCASDTARTRINLPITAGKAEPKLHFTCQANNGPDLSCDAKVD